MVLRTPVKLGTCHFICVHMYVQVYSTNRHVHNKVCVHVYTLTYVYNYTCTCHVQYIYIHIYCMCAVLADCCGPHLKGEYDGWDVRTHATS